MKQLRLVLVSFVLASAGTALAQPQHACFTNLVPNGDFESPVWQDPWVYSGQVVAQPRSFRTNGVDTNVAMEFTAINVPPYTFTIQQPTSFPLAAGTEYELSFDVYRPGAFDVDVGLTTNATRTSVLMRRVDGLRRVSERFTVTSSGAYTIDLGMSNLWGSSGPNYLDNVSIRAFRGVTFNLPDHRGRDRQPQQQVVVSGLPSRNFVIFLGIAGFSPPIPIPTCSGDWLLGLPPLPVSFAIGGTDSQGLHLGSLPVPASVSGAALYWQVVLLHPNCMFGCPVMIGFE